MMLKINAYIYFTFFYWFLLKQLDATLSLDMIRISVGISGIGQHSRDISNVGKVLVSEKNSSAVGELSNTF